MKLAIYVRRECANCRRALEIADWVRRRFPRLGVEVVDVEGAGSSVPPEVFAVPTYLLDGAIVSLGNPDPDALADLLRQRGYHRSATMGA